MCACPAKPSGRKPPAAQMAASGRGVTSRQTRRCNFNDNVRDTTPIGQYSPQGDSPYGCADMAGNVWEWTNSIFKGYDAQDGRESLKIQGLQVLRGGSLNNYLGFARCAFRFGSNPYYREVRRFSGSGLPVPGAVNCAPILNSGSAAFAPHSVTLKRYFFSAFSPLNYRCLLTSVGWSGWLLRRTLYSERRFFLLHYAACNMIVSWANES
jgi:hypothetical protein